MEFTYKKKPKRGVGNSWDRNPPKTTNTRKNAMDAPESPTYRADIGQKEGLEKKKKILGIVRTRLGKEKNCRSAKIRTPDQPPPKKNPWVT